MSTSNGNGTAVSSSTEWMDLATAARTFRVSKSTLRAYTNRGLLPSIRFGLAQSRRFKYDDLASLLGLRVEKAEEGQSTDNPLRVLAFARVSTNPQSEDLQRQIGKVIQYCETHFEGAQIDKHVAIRSGLNFEDSSAKLLLQQITSRSYKYLVCLHRERLARVAFTMLETLCSICGTQIIVIEKQSEDSQQELISDILALSHIASCRLYGKRGAKAHYKALSEDVVELISSLTLSGFSEREIFKRLQRENKAVDSQNRPFSISLVRRVRKQVIKQEEIKGVVSGNAAPSPASFESWAKRHLRWGVASNRRGTSERKILRAYSAACAAQGVAPQARATIRRFLDAKCPQGPSEVATGRLNRPTEIRWPVWLLRPQTGLIGVDKLQAAGVLQVARELATNFGPLGTPPVLQDARDLATAVLQVRRLRNPLGKNRRHNDSRRGNFARNEACQAWRNSAERE